MSRVLSFVHGPAPYVNHRKQIVVSEKILRRYDGTYKAPQSGVCEVKHANGSIVLTIGDKIYNILPESDTLF